MMHARKNIRDQIIEGFLDGDTVEELLQEKDLTLAKAITKCQALKAAKKQCANITSHHNESVAALQNPHKKYYTLPAGCGAEPHPGGRTYCPAYGMPCHNCKKIGHFAKVCCSWSTATSEPNKPMTPIANALSVPKTMLSNIRYVTSTDPAPTITVNITSCNGSVSTQALPDSGADISAAGKAILSLLNEHVSNLLASNIIPKAVNGTKVHPVGKLPVTFKLRNREHTEDLYIYPSVCGILMSWKACKGLGILPHCYPYPFTTDVAPLSKDF